MKIKQLISFGLSLIMTITSWNICFSEDTIEISDMATDIFQEDAIVSGQAVDLEKEENDGISLASLGTNMPKAGADKFIVPLDKPMPKAGTNGFIAEISEPDPNATIITTAEELANIQSGSYILGNDIDLSTYNGGIWIPINPTGEITLDGQGHKVTNMYIPESASIRYAGLFGEVGASITIKNIGVEEAKDGITSSTFGGSGGLIGSSSANIIIENSYNNGNVFSNHYSCGGLIGSSSKYIRIENSYNTGNISFSSSGPSGNDSSSGGLVGFSSASISVENSYNNGAIFSSSSSSGGLIGFIGYGGSSHLITIENSYNTGDVRANGILVGSTGTGSGGLIGYGYNDGGVIKIKNSYNIGKVYCNSSYSSSSSGGLVGLNDNWCSLGTSFPEITIENSYNIADIFSDYSGDSKYSKSCSGGLIGCNAANTTIKNCYSLGIIETTSINSNIYKGGIIGDRDGVLINGSSSRYGYLRINGENYYTDGYGICGDGDEGITYSDGAFCIKLGSTSNLIQFDNINYEFELGKDYEYHLSADLLSSTDDISDIVFTSSNTDVAEILDFHTETDELTNKTSILCKLDLKSLGTTIITVTNSTGASASCYVTVVEKEEKQLEVLSYKVSSQTYDGLPSIIPTYKFMNNKVQNNINNKDDDIVIEISFNHPVTINEDAVAYLCLRSDMDISNALRVCNIEYRYYPTIINLTFDSNKFYYGNNRMNLLNSALKDNTEYVILFSNNFVTPIDDDVLIGNINDYKIELNFMNGIVYGIDTYSFVHNEGWFYYQNENKKCYNISDKMKQKLISQGMSKKEIADWTNKKKWAGSCIGLTALAGMLKNKYINIKDIDKNSNSVFDLPFPRDSIQVGGVRDLANYITLLQYTDSFENSRKDTYKNFNFFNHDYEVEDILKGIVNSFNAEHNEIVPIVISIGYQYEEDGKEKQGGHALLPYYLDTTSYSNIYMLYCYDVNSLEVPVKIHILKDYSAFSIENDHYNNWRFIGYIPTNDIFNAMDENTIRTLSLDDSNKLIISDADNFTISNGTDTLIYKDGKFEGNADFIYDYYVNIFGENHIEHIFKIDNAEKYIVNTTSDKIDCTMNGIGLYSSIYAKNAGSIVFDKNYGMSVKGSNIEYSTFFSLEDEQENSVIVKGISDEDLLIHFDDKKKDVLIGTNNNISIDYIKGVQLINTNNNIAATNGEVKLSKDKDNNVIVADKEIVTEISTEFTTESISTEITTVSNPSNESTTTITESKTETTTVRRSYGSSGSGKSSRNAEKTTEATTENSTGSTTESKLLSKDVKVTIGNKRVEIGSKTYDMDVAPYIQANNSSTLVPLRFVALAICGGDIEKADTSKIIAWDGNTKTATITANNKVIKFTAGSECMIVDDKIMVMDNNVKAEIKDGRMFIPFRALGKALGVDVDWDADTKTAVYKIK